MEKPESVIVATIKVPLQAMLYPEEFDRMMAYSKREGIAPDLVLLHALRAFMPQMAPKLESSANS